MVPLPFSKRMTSAVAVFDSLFIASPIGAQTLTSNVTTISALQLEYAQLVTVYRLLWHQPTANNRVDLYAAIATATTVVQQLNATLNNLIFTSLFVDTFRRPNESPLNPATWKTVTPQTGVAGLAVVNNFCVAPGLADGGEEVILTALPDDQYVEATFVQDSQSILLLKARFTAIDASNYNAYLVTYYVGFPGWFLAIERYDSSTGMSTVLAQTTDAPWFVPPLEQTLRFELKGSSLTAYVNGIQQLQVTDSTYASGTVGMYIEDDGGSETECAASLFTAGSIIDPFAGLAADKALMLAHMRSVVASALQTLQNVQSDE